jgi:EAL domain-containing protein (putative c-di-GMP-specific phosphodiesterase class I)
VADVVRATVRATDLAFRLGGDEFAVIHRGASEGDAVTTAERIVEAIRSVEPRDPAVTYDVAASCGITLLHRDDELTPDAAMQQADAALYAAKHSARGGAYVFPDLGSPGAQSMLEQPLWGRRLHEAFTHDHFRLHAQPIVSLQDGSIAGFELLLRLAGTDESADEILRNISRLGRTRQLDRWVLEHAARAAIAYAMHLDGRRLTINLSITSLTDPEFATWVEQVIADVPGGRDRFIFEMTERDPITDGINTRMTADRLRALGVELMLDDFGTGYGSPDLLRALPFSGLKLARSFVAASGTSMVDTMIARHSSDLARALQITSVAEGIETEEVAIAMRAIGMTHGQGYLFGAPAPLETAFTEARPWHAASSSPGSSAR